MVARFTDETVVVTGAGTGMGRATAIRLADEGARVVLVGRRRAPLEEVAGEIAARGGAAEVVACDVAQGEAVAAAFAALGRSHGRIGGLFANAGVLGAFKPLAETDPDDFEGSIGVNLLGTFLTVRHCLPLMAGGAIVINASWTTSAVMPGAGVYAAGKTALLSLMRTLAVEQGPRGIRVNAINPGIIVTPMAEAVLDAATAARTAALTPLGRNGKAEDVAGTVAWLLSDDARFVTGQTIGVDGGFALAGPRL